MFQPLEKVACKRPGDPSNGLVKDAHYTIYRCFVDAGGNEAVELLELDPPSPHIGFLTFRFEKLVEDKQLIKEKENGIRL